MVTEQITHLVYLYINNFKNQINNLNKTKMLSDKKWHKDLQLLTSHKRAKNILNTLNGPVTTCNQAKLIKNGKLDPALARFLHTEEEITREYCIWAKQ